MDTDVELKKSLSPLLQHKAYFGFKDGTHVATGLGFGAIQGHHVVKEIMDDYEEIPFLREDGSYDNETCPSRNTKVLLRHGLRQDDSKQILDGQILILPSIYLCPLSFVDGSYTKSKETISVHWFSASWYDQNQQIERMERLKSFKKARIKRFARNTMHDIVHLPNRLLCGMMGKEKYEALKKMLKRGE